MKINFNHKFPDALKFLSQIANKYELQSWFTPPDGLEIGFCEKCLDKDCVIITLDPEHVDTIQIYWDFVKDTSNWGNQMVSLNEMVNFNCDSINLANPDSIESIEKIIKLFKEKYVDIHEGMHES